ncbi:hypothetical protein PQ469_06480 [Mucilaginibacter sp. KACC 22773]|uniref:hypothetical protein n=1 Tax=Mucilaginibacter sp. KACC 22773 TaxID=3025671 RepID=UPI0023651A38|nr:hypothetical protein [Mucilaginibacter sp. KACC 22773]WDF79651.1 hypothetical protein PQ469_06480 [Mucilaginibacter sp. KACC 22773]
MSIVKHLLTLGLPAKLRYKFKPLAGLPKLLPLNIDESTHGVLEASVVVEDDGSVKIYFTKCMGDTTNAICMATAASVDGEWTVNPTPIIGLGAGGAPADRQAHSSYVFKANGFYYCTATNGYGFGSPGEDRCLYLYKSVDGITFTDMGKLIDKSAIPGSSGFGNSCVEPILINGKYEMLLEGNGGGVWNVHRFNSDNIESGWTHVNALPGLQVVAGAMYGGTDLFYKNGLWYIFYHYGAAEGNLPTLLGFATSTDLVSITKKETPLFGIEAKPYGDATDQIADPFIIENNGKVFLLAEYVTNSPVVKSEIWIWEFNGTLNQLFANI